MCPKMLKSTKKQKHFDKPYNISFLHTTIWPTALFKCIPMRRINIDCTEGWLDYQKSIEKYLIVWSSVQDWGGKDDWDVAFDRWNYPSTVGGCHWVDPTHLCQRLCQLHNHRQRPLLAHGLQKCRWSNKNGNVALQGSHLCTFHGQVSFIRLYPRLANLISIFF